jgi:urease accessory protein
MPELASTRNIVVTTTESWHGQLDLQFTKSGNSTQLARSYARAPLKVQRPFYPETEVCHTVLLHTAGGIVGGDKLSSRLILAPQTQVLLTTAAAAKIYRSNGLTAHQTIEIEVGDDAHLEWLPQESIVFDRALYHQNMRVNLGWGATWCGWEITRLGRSASSEQFLHGQWRNAIEVWQAGRPLWIERQQLDGSVEQWQSLHGLATQPIVGTLALIGVSVEPDLVQQARDLWTGANTEMVCGVTRVQGGLVCRYRGSDRQEVQRWFIAVWDLVRRQYRDRTVYIPRVWQI